MYFTVFLSVLFVCLSVYLSKISKMYWKGYIGGGPIHNRETGLELVAKGKA
jgi:hypothetical protein